MPVKCPLRKPLFLCLKAAFNRYVSQACPEAHLEVERKFKIEAGDLDALPTALTDHGFKPTETLEMIDYFLPSYADGEMLRVRRQASPGSRPAYLLTAKGWQQSEDGGRERKETERQVKPIVALSWLILGRLILGGPLPSFSKQRRLFAGDLDGRRAVASIDAVTGLGVNSGTYLEIEVIVPQGYDVTPVRESIFALSAKLLAGGNAQVSRSYMDMLFEARAAA